MKPRLLGTKKPREAQLWKELIMIGLYELEYEGKKYFGNVSVREFHKFMVDGDAYLLDVQRMTSYKISKSTSSIIDFVFSSFGGLIQEGMVKELRKFNLISGDYEDSAETPIEKTAGDIPNFIFSQKTDAESGLQREDEFGVQSISLFISQKCNMKCVYCYGGGGGYGAGGLMSEETAFKAVDWLMENSKGTKEVHISFFGGEPLMNFSLLKRVVHYAKERAAELGKKVGFGMTTNASLLTDRIISFMKHENVNILISFDGPPHIQNSQRPFINGKGSFDVVYAKLQKLKESYPELTGRATVYSDADPFEIKKGMQKAGINNCMVMAASPVILTDANESETEIVRSKEGSERMIAFECNEADDLVSCIKERKIERNIVSHLFSGLISREKRYYYCGAGKRMAGVTVSGDIYPCHRFAGQEGAKMGSIYSYKVDGPNEYHKSSVDSLSECQACWARYFCGGGCLYDNKARTGDMRRINAIHCKKMKSGLEKAISVWCQLNDEDREYCKGRINKTEEENLP